MPGSNGDAGGARTPLAWGAFAFCSAIWGSTFLFISLGNDAGVDPIWAAALRLGLAAVLLTAIASRTKAGLPRGAALRAAAWYGLFGFGVNFSLLYWGEQIVPSGLTAVVFASIPLSTALFAHAGGLERLEARKIVAALVGFGGVALIFSGQLGRGVDAGPLVAVVIGATAAALANVMLKRGPHQSGIGANAVGAAVGFAVCLPVSFLAGERHVVPTSFDGLLPILYLTVAGSLGAFVVMVWLVNRWRVTTVSFMTLVIPVIAVILGALVRDEPFHLQSLGGTALVIAGVSLAIRADRRRAAAAAPAAPAAAAVPRVPATIGAEECRP